MKRGRRQRWGRMAVGIAAVAAAVGLWRGIDGWPDATSHLRDDAFYEFTWACNVARGNGGTVSDGVTTSGVQPLWCLLLAWLSSGQPRAIADFAVGLGCLCHVLGAATFAVAGRMRPAGLCAALLWLGNPLLLRECQNGQETALACLCAALLWHGRHARGWRFAALALLAVFARSELWLLVAALSVLPPRRRWSAVLATPLLTLLALVLWNRWSGGGVLPDSALPMAWLAHANFAATGPTLSAWLQQQWWLSRPVLLGSPFALVSAPALGALVFVALRAWWPRALRAVPLVLVGFAGLIGASDLWTAAVAATLLWLLPVRLQVRKRERVTARAWLLLLLGLVAIVALHWAVRWYPRDYYVAPLAVGAGAALQRLRRWPWLLVAIALATCMLPPLPREPLLHQRAMQVAAVVAPAVLPDGERVGCFNAGLLAFARLAAAPPTVAVLGLDGVVDHRAFAALQQGRLGAWLDAQQVRFVLDHRRQFALDPSLPHASGRWFGGGFAPERDLVELVRCVVPGVAAGRLGPAEFTLFWRRGHGPMPPAPAAARQLADLEDGAAVVLWPAQRDDVLEVEQHDGTRLRLLVAADAVCYALAVTAAARGTGRLFVHGAERPLLMLQNR